MYRISIIIYTITIQKERGYTMDSIAKKIKIALVNKDMNQSDLCKQINYTTGNLSKMLKRDTYKTDELEKIVNSIGYNLEITLIDKITDEKI
jgi:DNA-binding Xre family transcriptional regulator